MLPFMAASGEILSGTERLWLENDLCLSALITITVGEEKLAYALFSTEISPFAVLYYVLTSLEKFQSFEDVINIRNGGLAIYGGIIAGALTVFTVSRVKKIDFLALADCVAPGVLLAQGIGRWGNFMNGEAFGGETDIFIRMGIQNINSYYTFETAEMVYVHPTFLYESLWNLLGVLLVYLYGRYLHKKYDGGVHSVDLRFVGRFGILVRQGPSADAVDYPLVEHFAPSQRLEAHPVGVEWQYNLRLP